MYLYRVFIALALVGALTAVSHSQQRDQGAPPVQSGQQHPGAVIQFKFSTLPPWPPSGVVPERDAHRYVFLELATGDLVVSFPAGLGGGAPDTNSGQPITFRVRLPRHVQPSVSVRVRPLKDGTFEYTYRVRNGVAAKEAITSWHLDVSTLADTQIAEASPRWQHGSTVRVPGSKNLTSPMPGSHVIHWSLSNAGKADQAKELDPASTRSNDAAVFPGGAEVAGFRVVSRSRPGFVSAYFHGGTIWRESNQVLPADVQRQLDDATALENISSAVATLGPKYPPEMPGGQVAADFIQEVYQFMTRKLLNSTSPFVQEVLSALDTYRQGSDWGSDMPALSLSKAPDGPLEAELALAIGLAKGSRP